MVLGFGGLQDEAKGRRGTGTSVWILAASHGNLVLTALLADILQTILQVFQMSCLRFSLCGFTWRDHKINVNVRLSCRVPSIAAEIRFKQLCWDM